MALFSDVDGTLLGSRGRLALTRADVAALSATVELILASSRTVAELVRIQRLLGLMAPLIAENGAVVSFPPSWRGAGRVRRETLAIGQTAAVLRRRIALCARRAAVSIVDQRDTLPDRGRSIRRTHSVCVRNWTGPGARRFLRELAAARLAASVSGHWITITSGADKATGVRQVLARARDAGVPFRVSAAVGNAGNDQPLLAAVRHRFAIRNPRGHHPALLALPGVHALPSAGPRAWRTLIAMIPDGRR